jgi:hypothetical protein
MNLISILKHAGCRPAIFRKLTLTSSILLLSACGISDFKPNFEKFSFYTLNPESGAFCKRYDSDENLKYCRSIIPTNFSHIETRKIENVYLQDVVGPNRVMSLVNIITAGENLTYTPVQLANGLYKLPINEQTNTVWDVIFKLADLNKK